MADTLSKNYQGRYGLSDGTYFTVGDEIEVKLEPDRWVRTRISHNILDYCLKDLPGIKLEGLIARKP